MGKFQSKHASRNRHPHTEAECFYVNSNLNKAIQEEIWKKKTGYNLANYNMDQSISELSIHFEEKPDNIPLRVDLPPSKEDTETAKVLMIDQDEEIDLKDKITSESSKNNSRLNIEEFECGVHVEGSENSKQEWSFTLYDFDGHGKITREDLSGLLKALYDTVGSSINIPQNGTKTLKLRLTVGQDNSQIQEGNITTQESPKIKPKDYGKNKDTGSPRLKDIKLKDCSKVNNLMQTASPKCNNKEKLDTKRLHFSCKETQQLADLVQENMERNHVKQLRRHHSEGKTGQDHSHQKRRHRNQAANKDKANNSQNNNPNNNNCEDEKPKESIDRRNYYLDLAGIENTSSKFHDITSPPSGAKNVLLAHGHHRSRSHEPTQKCDNVKKETEQLTKDEDNAVNSKFDHTRSRSFDPQETVVNSPKGPKKVQNTSSPHKHTRFRPVSLPTHVPETVSPHYHRRHRHREKDHDLAMQQVAEWIEREHSFEVDGERVVIQKHEHHHVHEHHHHHHYHHYYEA